MSYADKYEKKAYIYELRKDLQLLQMSAKKMY